MLFSTHMRKFGSLVDPVGLGMRNECAEDGSIGIYDLESGNALSFPLGKDEVILSVDCTSEGWIAAGSMGSRNQVYIVKPLHCCV